MTELPPCPLCGSVVTEFRHRDQYFPLMLTCMDSKCVYALDGHMGESDEELRPRLLAAHERICAAMEMYEEPIP